MKTFALLPILALALWILPGCKKNNPPSACISSLPATVRVDTTLTFSACSPSSGTTYLWNFGDGQTSSTNPATHNYTTAGTFTVTLTATNGNGTNTQTTSIVITPGNQVKTQTITAIGVSIITTYTYDAQGRCVSANENNNLTTYTYGQGTVTINSSTGTTYGALNSNGLIIRGSDSTYYTYDANGYLIAETNTGTGNSQTNTISNGNLVSEVQTVSGSTVTNTFTYGSSYDSRNFGLAFRGKQSVNLCTSNISSGSTTTYSYTYDSYGRIATETISQSGPVVSYTYTYY
jgi:YD repeat-containing protein